MTAQFVLAGIPKLFMLEADIRGFNNWGYSTAFLFFIGVMESVCGILLIPRKTAAYGAIMPITVMIGAAYTHITSGIESPVPALVNIALLLLILSKRLPNSIPRSLNKSGDDQTNSDHR